MQDRVIREMLDALRKSWIVDLRGDDLGWLLTLSTKHSNEIYEYAGETVEECVLPAWAGAPEKPRAVGVGSDSE